MIYGNLSEFFPRIDAIYANYINSFEISQSKIAQIKANLWP